jgi:hypothetical protein
MTPAIEELEMKRIAEVAFSTPLDGDQYLDLYPQP